MPDLKLPPFRMIHAAYVTADLEAGKRRLAGTYGIESFALFSDVAVRTAGGEAKIAFALAEVGGATLEVIQPAGGDDHVYRQMLPADPEDIVLHHFATRIVDRAEWDLIHDTAARNAIAMPVRHEAEAADEISYVYLDTREKLGHMLEFIWLPPDADPAVLSTGESVERVS